MIQVEIRESAEETKIILTPIETKLNLQKVLDNSPKDCLRLHLEDQQWLNL